MMTANPFEPPSCYGGSHPMMTASPFEPRYGNNMTSEAFDMHDAHRTASCYDSNRNHSGYGYNNTGSEFTSSIPRPLYSARSPFE